MSNTAAIWGISQGGGGAPTIIDSYSETNQDATFQLDSIDFFGVGQSFTATAVNLGSCQFYLSKTNLPTGNAVARLYGHTGTFGANGGKPDGNILASSDNFNVATLTGSLALIPFTFSGANQYAMSDGVHYVIVLEYTGGDGSNKVNIGFDASTPSAAGCIAYSTNLSTWTGDASYDACFYVYSV